MELWLRLDSGWKPSPGPVALIDPGQKVEERSWTHSHHIHISTFPHLSSVCQRRREGSEEPVLAPCAPAWDITCVPQTVKEVQGASRRLLKDQNQVQLCPKTALGLLSHHPGMLLPVAALG